MKIKEIKISRPPYKRADGTIVNRKELSVTNYRIEDTVENGGNVKAIFHPSLKPLILWSGEEYDKLPSYTNEDVGKRVNDLLGENPSEILSSLL